MSFHAGRIRAGTRSCHAVSGAKKHDDAARIRIMNGPIKFDIASPNGTSWNVSETSCEMAVRSDAS